MGPNALTIGTMWHSPLDGESGEVFGFALHIFVTKIHTFAAIDYPWCNLASYAFGRYVHLTSYAFSRWASFGIKCSKGLMRFVFSLRWFCSTPICHKVVWVLGVESTLAHFSVIFLGGWVHFGVIYAQKVNAFGRYMQQRVKNCILWFLSHVDIILTADRIDLLACLCLL